MNLSIVAVFCLLAVVAFFLPMTGQLRLVRAAASFALALFCIFGLMASFEAKGARRLAFQGVCMLIGASALAAGCVLVRRKT